MGVDIRNITATPNGRAAVTVPRFVISFDVFDSQTGALRRSVTGVQFPAVIDNLSAAELRELLTLVVEFMLRQRNADVLG